MYFIFYPRPFSGLVFSNRIFISDTVGNLIAFSDGTFSGETADQELAKPEALPSQMVGNFVIQYNLVSRKDSGIPESVKFLLVECEDPEIFLVESGILGLWNPEYLSRKSESKFYWRGIRNPVPRFQNPAPDFRNPQRGFQNPRLSWIPLHEANNRITHVILVC